MADHLGMETRVASSVRGLHRRYGIDREILTAEIRAGRLPAARISKHRYAVLHADFEAWLRSRAVQPDADAAHVARVLAREESRRAG